MPIRLDFPYFLLLVPLVVIGLLYTRDRMLSLWGWRRTVAILLRFTAATGIAIALAQPSVGVADDASSVVYAMDVSASMSPAAKAASLAWLNDALKAKQHADKVAVVTFAGDARVVRTLDTSDAPMRSLDDGSLHPETNDLGQAVRVASALVRGKSNARVVLLSSGNATAGDLDAALRDAHDVPIDVVPIARPPDGPEVQIEGLQIPQYVRAGESFEGTVVIDSTETDSPSVQVALDGKVVSEKQVQVSPGVNRLPISMAVTQEGFHPIAVRILPSRDSDTANNVSFGYVVVKPKPRVLILEERPGEGEGIHTALRGAEMTLDVRAPEILPPLTQLNEYAAVVLSNVAATSFTLDQQKTLDAYVGTHGHGLLALGGLTSYQLGGYGGTLLENILPVLAKPPERREGAQIALLLIIDRSASMDRETDGVTRMAIAKNAALLAVQNLDARDTIGVLVFDKKFEWIVRPGVIEQLGRESIENRISRLQAEGGTDIYSALKEGADVMRSVPGDLKHIILLTDGRGTEVKYDELMAQIRQRKIGLSTVAIGEDADTELMARLARQAQGRYYATDRVVDLPRIITSEENIAKRAALVDGKIQPQFVTSSPILRSIVPNQIPALNGHIATTAKDAAEVVLASDEGAPLLAQWHYGLGRAVAWTSDIGSPRWSIGWSSWDQNTLFWEQATRWAMGPPINRDFRLDVRRTGNQARVSLEDVRDARFVDLADLRATVVAPGGASSEVALRQVAPGFYQADVVATSPGTYQVTVVEPGAPRTSRSESIGFAVPPVAQIVSFTPNEATLRRVASETGGVVRASPTGGPALHAADAVRWDPVWSPFVVLALAAFVVDIALRRLRPTTLRALFGRARSREAPFSVD